MTLEEIYQGYALNDGQILSFEMTYSVDRTITIILQLENTYVSSSMSLPE